MRRNPTRGFGLVEVVVGAAIIAVAFVGILSSFDISLRAGLANTQKIQAALYAEEGLEAVRYLRDSSWSTNLATLATSTPYYLVFRNIWAISTTTSLDGIFTRTITVDDVYRDATTKDIVPSSASSAIDSNTLKVTASVTWPSSSATTSTATYLANLFNN